MGRQSNKKRRSANAANAREKAATARALQQRAEQRRRAMMILTSVVVVVVVAAVIVVVALNHKTKSDRAAAPASVVSAVTSVSDSTLQSVGAGNVLTLPAPLSGKTPLQANGKPEVLYIGAEFCPYCAAERWALAVALSKFGTFSGLNEVRSAPDDGDYASLDFDGSSYTSQYLTFEPVEDEDRNGQPLQNPTSAQSALWASLSGGASHEGFPTIDFGNKYVIALHPPLDPSVLGSSDQEQIAGQLNDPTSKVAQTLDGGANDDIAAICSITGNQPAAVCGTSTVTGLETKLAAQTPS